MTAPLGASQRLVLKALNDDHFEQGMTAVDISKWLHLHGKNRWDRLTTDSVYGVLKRLHSHGYVAATARAATDGHQRGTPPRLWQITDAGRKALKAGTDPT